MTSHHALAELIRRSRELAEQSRQLKAKVQETLSESTNVIDRSRELLSMWPANGTPWLAGSRRAGEPSSNTSRGRSTAAAEDLEQIVEQNFVGEGVRLDGRHFVDCHIEDCVLQYNGGPVILEGTNFTGCRFQFGGEAAMTISMLECFGLIDQQYGAAHATPNSHASHITIN